MHRKPLLELLDRYQARHPEEAPCVARVRALVAARADCFERSCPPGHVTGSAFVVSADGRRALLVHHRKLDRWLQPGGHADGESDVAQVALREAREETGLAALAFAGPGDEPAPFDLDVHEIPARPGEPAHEHHDVRFLLVAAAGQEARASEESHAVRWFSLDAISGLALDEITGPGVDESVARMARKARALLGARGRD